MDILIVKYRPRENGFSPFLRSRSNRDTKMDVPFEKQAYSTAPDQGFFDKNQHST